MMGQIILILPCKIYWSNNTFAFIHSVYVLVTFVGFGEMWFDNVRLRLRWDFKVRVRVKDEC